MRSSTPRTQARAHAQWHQSSRNKASAPSTSNAPHRPRQHVGQTNPGTGGGVPCTPHGPRRAKGIKVGPRPERSADNNDHDNGNSEKARAVHLDVKQSPGTQLKKVTKGNSKGRANSRVLATLNAGKGQGHVGTWAEKPRLTPRAARSHLPDPE